MISEGLSYIDFVFDIVCMMPPLDSPYSAIISRDHAIYFTLAACTMLILSVVFITVKKENPEFVNLALVGTLVILILGFISASNLIKSECIVGYPAMIITLRLGELSLAGYRISKKISLSFLLAGILAFFLSVIIIYYYLVRLSPDKIAIIKYGWGGIRNYHCVSHLDTWGGFIASCASGKLANSVIYPLVAIPSRIRYTRFAISQNI